ncbi:MAG: hybrid sensor histidine kinase/response regulator [Nitrosomonadales bacterium]|nr:MAG: hybrid sensor histidine kinase/response regulator [Nitrosomonadales bacterium]
MSIEFDTGPLTWVKGEIDQALRQASEKLAQFATDASDNTPLRQSQTHLHQVSGAIQMVGLEGVARFSEAIEKLVAALEKREAAISAANIGLINQSLDTLSQYLEGLLNGQPDQPLRLFPLYQPLLAARGVEKISESELFFPDLSIRAPKSAAARQLSEQELPAFLKGIRTRYQRGLLSFLRNPDDPAGPQAMHEALASIEQTQTVPAHRTFWWAALGLTESLLHKGLENSISIKQLCGSIDQQIRRLAEGSPKVAERLLRDVLYFVARSEAVSDRVREIQDLFELEAYVPRADSVQQQAEAEQQRQQPLLRELRDILAPAKDAWLKFTAGSADSLANLRAQSRRLAEKAAALDNPPLDQLLQQINAGAEALASAPGIMNEMVAMEMATALLLAENNLENYLGATAEFSRQSEVQTRRLQASLQGTLDEEEIADIPLLDEISRQAQEKLLLAQVGQEIQSNLQHIEQVLDSFFRDTSRRDDLPGLKPFLKQVYGALKILDLEPAVKLLDECESLINGFSQPGHEPRQEQLEQVAEGLSSLGFYVESIQRGRTDAVQIIDEAMARLRPETAPAAAEPEPEEEITGSAAAPQPGQPAVEGDESSYVEAGLDEQKHRAQELLQQWQQNPEDELARNELHQQLTSLQQDADLVADAELKSQATEAKRLLEESAAPTIELAAAAAALAAPRMAVAAPSAEIARLAQETDETVDAEMLEIFLEEADEVLATVNENLAICHGQPSDRDALTTLRRSFHTLKGSGRMVGLWELGEVAWAIEQVMNKWLQEEKHATPELLALLGQAYEHFSGWVSGLKIHGAVKVEADALVAEAERLRTGAAAVPPPVSAEPPAAEEAAAVPEPFEAIAEEIAVPEEQEITASTAPQAVEEEITLLPPAEEPAAEAETAEVPLPEEAVSTEGEHMEAAESGEEIAAELTEGALELAPEAPEAIEPGSEEAPFEAANEEAPPETGIPEAEAAPEEVEVSVGSVSLPLALYKIFINESGQHLAALQHHFDALSQNPDTPVQHDFMRAAHTLCGISRTVGFPVIADLGFPLELWLQELLQHPAPVTDKQHKVMGDTIAALHKMIDTIRGNKEPKPAKQLIRSLQALLKKAQAARIPAEPAAVEEPLAAPVPAAAAADQQIAPVIAAAVQETALQAAAKTGPERRAIRDDIDAELLPIFLEEAEDLFPLVGTELRAWRSNTSDSQASNNLQRALHTIKGSARMAGAMRLGELTHNMEAQVLAAAESGHLPPDLFDTLENEFDRMGDVLDHLRHGTPQEETVAPSAARITPAAATATAAAALAAEPEAAAKAMLRVRADVVDRLVNEAGEVSIARSRIEGEMQGFKRSLFDLTESISRLRNQLREIEIQAESQMQSQLSHAKESNADFDPLEFDRFTRLQEVTRMMAESVNDVASVQHNLLKNLDETEAALLAQSRMTKDLQQELLRTRMVPLASISERLYRVVRQTSKELGKRANLDIIGEQVELDRSVLEKITAPFEHLLRNAVDHGLESQDQRLAAGKLETGSIELQARQEGNEILITLSDDGRGIDLAGIRAKAVEQGLLAADAEAAPAQLIELIFAQGFSTAAEVTQVSGRGIGMDVVRNEIASLGGRVEAASEAGKGTTFSIYLPLTLAVTQAVLVRSGNTVYALPSTMVDQVQELKANALADVYRKQEVLWQGNHYPLHYFPRLLGDLESVPAVQRYTTIMLLHSGVQRVAIHVDELIGNREIVVKNIGPQLARVPGIAGATVLGNGKVVLILNPVQLAQRHDIPALVTQQAAAPAAGQPTAAAPVVMIVDDSLTVRKITSKLLTREGYLVVTAKDGVDALQALEDVTPQVMLVDIEMPRMDGFELTKNVRGNAKTAHIPIIMITSRTAEKHRNYAQELGVNVYLGKPYQEEELLGYISGFVKGSLH